MKIEGSAEARREREVKTRGVFFFCSFFSFSFGNPGRFFFDLVGYLGMHACVHNKYMIS